MLASQMCFSHYTSLFPPKKVLDLFWVQYGVDVFLKSLVTLLFIPESSGLPLYTSDYKSVRLEWSAPVFWLYT